MISGIVSLTFGGILLLGFAAGARTRDELAAKLPEPAGQSINVSTLPDDIALGRQIDRLLGASNVSARWGVFVISARDGRVLYSHDADKSFTPASNMKVYTTAAALDLLGGEYHWRTSVYARKPPDANGVIDGELTLYGRGAPDLLSKPKGESPSLTKLADQLYQTGVREVSGDIVGDASYLRGELFGLGWQWNDLQWYYGAEPSALSVDENTVEVTMSPAAKNGDSANVIITPNQNFIRLKNDAITSGQDEPTTIGIIRDLTGNEVRVWGKFPAGGRGFSAFLSVHDPAGWAAAIFKQALIARGIKVTGQTRSRDFRVSESEKFDPQRAFEVTYIDSETLAHIVRRTNKESNNLFAELLLRTIGKERGNSAPDSDARKNAARGDDEAGTAVITKWLESKSITTRDMAIRDGSGLSRLDLVTPEATGRLLLAMTTSAAAGQFRDSLPIAGQDGTLSSRLKNLTGRLVAKTGTLTYTHSLSGYASARGGEVLVFSIMCNDALSDRAAVGIIDQIASTIADFGPARQRK